MECLTPPAQEGMGVICNNGAPCPLRNVEHRCRTRCAIVTFAQLVSKLKALHEANTPLERERKVWST
jgi:hypothetical protein